MLRAVFPEAILAPKNSSVHTFINLRSAQLISEVDALIDSGTTDNFISPDVIQQFDIPIRILNKQLAIRNVDGTPNKFGEVDRAADLTF
ncbi:MAG TPA: retropepsin-like aspartic protease [Methylomirabilota bacterium]|nr:retropepsin-like aspartic protease [Methylomirabilota bacterium]